MAILDQVESALFGAIIGLTEHDPDRVAEHHRRMKHFMQLSNHFRVIFGDEWPNR